MSQHIHLVINALRGGGAERVCVTVANELVARGHAVKLVVLDLDGARYAEDLDDRVQLVHLGTKHTRYAFGALWRYVGRAKPRFMLAFNHQIAVLLVVIRWFLGRPQRLVVRNRNTLSVRRRHVSSLWHRYVVHGITRLLYPRVDAVIAQSKGMKQDLVEHFGFRMDRIRVIPNPIAPEIYGAAPRARAEEGDEDATASMLFVGRLVPQKGVDHLLDVTRQCLTQQTNVRLDVVGTGPERSRLQQRARDLGIEEHVVFHGFVDDVTRMYRSASVTVLPSQFEGFPNVLLESIALGTPVVAYDCPSGPREIIRDGVNGFLVPLNDRSKLAEAVREAIRRTWNGDRIVSTASVYHPRTVTGQYVEHIVGG